MAAAIREEREGYRGDIVHSRWPGYSETSRKRVARPGKLIVKSQYPACDIEPQKQGKAANRLPVTIQGETAAMRRCSDVLNKCTSSKMA